VSGDILSFLCLLVDFTIPITDDHGGETAPRVECRSIIFRADPRDLRRTIIPNVIFQFPIASARFKEDVYDLASFSMIRDDQRPPSNINV